MDAEFVSAPGLYTGVPYSYAAVAPAGRLVFTAGACPLDEAGAIVAPGDVEVQARRALENLVVVLAAAGAAVPSSIVKTTVFVASADGSDLVCAWRVVEAGLQPARPPSTLLGVAALGYPGQLVEIEAVAIAR